MPSQYDSAKISYNQSFPMQNSSVMQQHIQLDAEKRRQLFKIRQDQIIQAQQHARGISDTQLRSTQFMSLPSHLQQQPPLPYTTQSSVSTASVNESSSQNS